MIPSAKQQLSIMLIRVSWTGIRLYFEFFVSRRKIVRALKSTSFLLNAIVSLTLVPHPYKIRKIIGIIAGRRVQHALGDFGSRLSTQWISGSNSSSE
jgi:hypothetical protein